MNKAASFVLLAWLGGVSAWGADRPVMWMWGKWEKTNPARVEIDVRADAPVVATSFEAKAGEQLLPVKLTPLDDVENARTAVLFLIDKSDPKRARAIEAAKALTLRLADLADARNQVAVYAFDSTLVPVVDWETPRDEMAARLKTLKATGLATELYRNAIAALGLLERTTANRRALVLLSDGKAEDTTYTLDQVIAAAKKSNIAIFSVGYAETPQDAVHLQSLRRLSADSIAPFVAADVATKKIPEQFVDEFFPILWSGGLATVDVSEMKAGKELFCDIRAGSLQTTFTVALDSGDKKAEEMASAVQQVTKKVEEMAQQVAAVPAKVEEATKKAEQARLEAEKKAAEEAARRGEEELKRTEAARAEAQAMDERRAMIEGQDRLKRRAIWGAGLLALLVALGFIFFRRRQAEPPAGVDAAPVFARLQVLDGDGTEHLTRTTALRVGRGKDNDLSLGNDSVSRHHAEISRTRDGTFTITEINAGNGVLVNGETVEKATLKNEDIIELGEVRIRFLVAPQTSRLTTS